MTKPRLGGLLLAALLSAGCGSKGSGSKGGPSGAGGEGGSGATASGGSGGGGAVRPGAAGTGGAGGGGAGGAAGSGTGGAGGTVARDAAAAGADAARDALAAVDAPGSVRDAAGPDTRPAAECRGVPKLKLTTVVAAMASPLALAQPAGDPRLYVAERRGRIRIVKNGMLVARAFLDLSASTTVDGSRGFFGLAFHPRYGDNGRFFVFYTRSPDDPHSPGLQFGDIVIAEGRRSAADPEQAEAALKPVLTIPAIRTAAFGDHHGGHIVFGPDGHLWVAVGDGGGQRDPHRTGQNLMSKLGKILRIDVDNPTARLPGNAPGADPHVWSWGLRNPWRFSFDRATGDFYVGDVGQNDFEEIDFVPRGEAGRNFGWSVMEASACFPRTAACDKSGKALPIWEYDQNVGKSITGGHVYRGQAIPCLQGRYLFGDYNRNRVFSFVVKDGKATDAVELTSDLNEQPIGGLVSFGEDAAGEIYLLNLSIAGGMGRIYRIDAE